MAYKFYKAGIYGVYLSKNKEHYKLDSSVLTKEYASCEAAYEAAEAQTAPYAGYVIEVREYTSAPGSTAIIAFGSTYDTGICVRKDANSLIRLFQNEYWKYENEMSEQLQFCLENPETDGLTKSFSLLSEDDVNYLLEWSGDDEYVWYEDGKFVSVDEPFEIDIEKNGKHMETIMYHTRREFEKDIPRLNAAYGEGPNKWTWTGGYRERRATDSFTRESR